MDAAVFGRFRGCFLGVFPDGFGAVAGGQRAALLDQVGSFLGFRVRARGFIFGVGQRARTVLRHIWVADTLVLDADGGLDREDRRLGDVGLGVDEHDAGSVPDLSRSSLWGLGRNLERGGLVFWDAMGAFGRRVGSGGSGGQGGGLCVCFSGVWIFLFAAVDIGMVVFGVGRRDACGDRFVGVFGIYFCKLLDRSIWISRVVRAELWHGQ